MKAPRKILFIFLAPVALATVTIWHLSGVTEKPAEPPEQRVQIFARAPQQRPTDLSKTVAAISSLLVNLDGGPAVPPPPEPPPAAEAGPVSTLKGVITDYFGNAPGACRVFLRATEPGELAMHSKFNTSFTTGTDGLLVAQGVGAGAWDLLARCERGLGRLRGVQVSAEGVSDFGTLKLEQGGTVRGTVVESGSRKAVEGAGIALSSGHAVEGAPEAGRLLAATTDPDGRFELEAVPEGAWVIRVEAAGFITKELPGINARGRGAVDLRTIFLVRGDVEKLKESTSFGGIGVSLGRGKDSLRVDSVIKGTPAFNAGLQAGDQILAIGGQPASELALDEAIALIRGDERTNVLLKIRRGETVFDIQIVRDTIKP